MMNKKELLHFFITCKSEEVQKQKGSNLYIIIDNDNINLINYTTIIAYKKISNNNIIYLNNKRYSKTTTTNTNKLRELIKEYNKEVKEY